VIRGWCIGRYGAFEDSADPDVQRLFFNGKVRYLNAYIVNEQDQRTLPAPISWKTPKYKPEDQAARIEDKALKPDNNETFQKTKGISGFVTIVDKLAYITQPQRVLNVHNERARRGGDKQANQNRQRRTDGTVYRYDALAAGQVFEGIIHCDDPQDLKRLQEWLQEGQTLSLGGARSAGYGRAEFVLVSEAKPEPPPPKFADKTILTCLSDVIVRNAHGEYQASQASLFAELERQGIVFDPEQARTILDTTLVGGFNRKWGLPLPQTPAIKMGSVIVFDASVAIPAALLEQGIGERTVEGFGQIAVNWHTHDTYAAHKSSPQQQTVTTHQTDQAVADRLIARITQYQERQKEAVKLAKVFEEAQYHISGTIPRTQLARLRYALATMFRQTIDRAKAQACIQEFLTSIEGKYADKQYSDARINGLSLKDWLKHEVTTNQAEPTFILQRIDAVLERKQKASKGR
jgi:CRISPR-associated protein Csx10